MNHKSATDHELLHISLSEVRCTGCEWSLVVPMIHAPERLRQPPRSEALARKGWIRNAFASHLLS